jgi:hypothetical protein
MKADELQELIEEIEEVGKELRACTASMDARDTQRTYTKRGACCPAQFAPAGSILDLMGY